jgi:hypothetical protein
MCPWAETCFLQGPDMKYALIEKVIQPKLYQLGTISGVNKLKNEYAE